MNRTDYVKVVAERSGKTQKEIKEILEVMQDVAYAEMARCEEVKIFDGVTLVGKDVPEKEHRNPQTGAPVLTPQHIAPKAKFGKYCKDFLNV